jgi:asparagine synthase (glutamine-hydrolysing)
LLELSGRLSRARRRSLYAGRLAEVSPTSVTEAIREHTTLSTDDPLLSTLELDAQLALVDHMLLYFDRASMAHSLEVRVPFLDHRLVEWAACLPVDARIKSSTTKRVLRAVAAHRLPSRPLDKPKVGFMRHALTEWLVAQLDAEPGARLRDSGAAYTELLDPVGVERLVQDFRRGRREEDARLVFAVLLLEFWMTRLQSTTTRTAPISTR